jgi:hypothetical protein
MWEVCKRVYINGSIKMENSGLSTYIKVRSAAATSDPNTPVTGSVKGAARHQGVMTNVTDFLPDSFTKPVLISPQVLLAVLEVPTEFMGCGETIESRLRSILTSLYNHLVVAAGDQAESIFSCSLALASESGPRYKCLSFSVILRLDSIELKICGEEVLNQPSMKNLVKKEAQKLKHDMPFSIYSVKG